MDKNIFRARIVLEKHLFVLGTELWDDDFSTILDLFKDHTVDVWKLRKGRFPCKNCTFPKQSPRLHLENWGMLGTVVG